MAKVRVHNFAISADGYAAGPNQTFDNPLGEGGTRLHEWVFATRTGARMFGETGGEEGTDDDFFAEGDKGLGATIMGRNMFGPIRGLWEDEEWKGWWGDDPPYHHPVFVLTRYPRESFAMEGGTTFHFVTDGIESALEQALKAAGGRDVRIGGGAATIQQFLKARLIDEMHVAIVPILLGAGERLFDNLEGGPHGYEISEFVATSAVAHLRLSRKPE
jgi:dihydrofolate reductase